MKQKSIQFQIHGKVNAHHKWTAWANTNILKLCGSYIFHCEALIHIISNTWEKWLHVVRENVGNHKHSKVKAFLNILREAEIHAVPKSGMIEFPCYENSMRKHKHFPGSTLPCRFTVDKNSPMSVNVQIPIIRKYSVENHIVPRLWVFEKNQGIVFHIIENRWEYPHLFHSWIWSDFSC